MVCTAPEPSSPGRGNQLGTRKKSRSDAFLDLLISDVGLPGLYGRQLAEIAGQTRAQLRVLFITGYAAMAASRADFLRPAWT